MMTVPMMIPIKRRRETSSGGGEISVGETAIFPIVGKRRRRRRRSTRADEREKKTTVSSDRPLFSLVHGLDAKVVCALHDPDARIPFFRYRRGIGKESPRRVYILEPARGQDADYGRVRRDLPLAD